MKQDLIGIYGRIDSESLIYCFSTYSTFYDMEIGGTVYRQFISFSECVAPQLLVEIKNKTNNIETKYSQNGHRKINIDS